MVNPQSPPVSAFYAQSQDPTEDVFFGLIPKALGSPYRMSGIASDVTASVFFQSEPIILEMIITNHTKRPIPVAGTKGRWVNLLEWQILKDGAELDPRKVKMADRSAEIKLSASGSPMNSDSIDILTLGIGESIKKEISLVSVNGAALPVGKYKIVALLTPNSLGNQFPQPNRAIQAQTDFIVTKIESLGDQLSYYSRLAQRYKIDKEYDKAQAILKQMLRLNPNSIFAFTTLGDMSCEQGKPQQASEYFRKAITILENNLDENHRSFDQKYLRESLIAVLKQKLASGRCAKRS